MSSAKQKDAIELAMKIKAANPELTRRQALARAIHLLSQLSK